MPIVFVPFDGWSPGGSDFGEGWETALNIYPAYDSARPWRKFLAAGPGAVDGPMTGRHTHIWASGAGTGAYLPDAQTIFTGSPTKLYTVDPASGAFTSVSRVGGYGPNMAGWRFVSIGNDIWATDAVDPLQRRTNNAGLFANGVVSTFKPQPRYITTVREHFVGANLSNAGRFQDEVVWSDADDATNFDPAPGGSTSTSLAGNKRLVSVPGQITGLVGGQYLLAFKRNAIFYGEYAGYPTIFNFDLLSSNVGTGFPSSIIVTRYGTFFVGPDGIYRITGLSAPQKISPPGVDQYLLDSTVTNEPNSSFSFYGWQEDTQLVGFQSTAWPLVGWAFRNLWQDPGNVLAILYNPVTDSWGQVQIEHPVGTQPTMVVERPYARDNYAALAALTWDGTNSAYAELNSGGTVYGPLLALRFRPANLETALPQGQSTIKGVLPIFSRSTVLSPQVSVTPLLDPFNTTGATETRTAAQRDVVAGWYPFQTAGRFFRIVISCAAEDFDSFEGCFVNQELLR